MLSPMQSEDGSTKPVRTESKHSKLKNSTVLRNLNIRNSSNTVVNLRAVTVRKCCPNIDFNGINLRESAHNWANKYNHICLDIISS